MTDFATILIHEFPGRIWRFTVSDEDYSSLEWDESNTIPKPTEAELLALEASALAKKAALDQRLAEARKLDGEVDGVLRQLERIARMFDRIIAAMPATQQSNINQTPLDRMKQFLASIRPDPGD